jgi:formylglycine-generating enzyme required for sulfatase activity
VFLKALAVDPRERHARAGELWSAFESAITSMFSSPEWRTPSPSMVSVRSSRSEKKPREKTPEAPKKTPRRWPLVLGGAVVLTGVVAVAAIGLKGSQNATSEKMPQRMNAGATTSSPSPITGAAGCPAGMREIAGARFFMGTDEKGVPKNQRPAHQVTIGPYCMDVNEVSVDEYKRCADAGACREPLATVEWPSIREKERVIYGAACNGKATDRGTHPMNCVTWEEANAACTHRGSRLPREAEWEYAARGKKLTGGHPWGASKPTARLVNVCDADCVRWSQRQQAGLEGLVQESDGFATTAPVEHFASGCSDFGVCGLADNVREWTNEAYAAHGKSPTSERVIRGGAWTSGEAIELRRTYRDSLAPGVRRHDVGFRCARSLDTKR